MEAPIKRGRGRPRKVLTPIQQQLVQFQQQGSEQKMSNTFVSVNTTNVKGLRVNITKVNTYAPNSDTSIQLAWGDGIQTTLNFPNREEMLTALAQIDSKVL